MIMVICYKDISCKNILLENQRTDWDICDYIHNMLYVKRATVRVLEFGLKPTSAYHCVKIRVEIMHH